MMLKKSKDDVGDRGDCCDDDAYGDGDDDA